MIKIGQVVEIISYEKQRFSAEEDHSIKLEINLW